jgi:integrase
VNTLTKKDCIELVQHWAATGLRTQSLRLMLSVLRAALTGATGTHLPANPAFGLNRECRQPDEVKHEWRPYTLEESETFLAHARGLEPRAYTMFLIGFRAGLRIGETLALQWGDVDFAGHRLAVQRSRNQEGIVTSPKRGRRYVDLGDELATHLRTLPKVDPAALVCTTAGGDAYEQRTVSNLFHRVIRSAKMRHIRVHDMRHTFASQLLERGVPLHYVKEQLGHSSIKITADLYAHLVPGANREWVNRLTPAYPVAPALQ